jgi:UPF0716 protein FxsA
MNSLLLIIVGIPAIEILLIIKVGQYVGAINTILLIFLTATIGVYCARVEGLSTIKSGFLNIYKNKPPIYEMISGASIAIAACLLILPGFLTDAIGFIILFPLTRKYLIKSWLKKNYKKEEQFNGGTIDGEIIEEKDKKSDEL